MTETALVYVAPGRADLREVPLGAGDGHVRVRTLWSGISRGTERLVFHGRVPETEWQRMRAPFQAGDFPFPVTYGYAAVGRIEDGPHGLAGRVGFCLHPHQTRFSVPADAVVPLPDGMPPRRAVLAANMETALNAVWDGGALPAQRIVVVGGGVLGLLIGFIAARLPGAAATIVDTDPERAAIAERLGTTFALPDAVPPDADLVFHTSATETGLATALAAAGSEASVVEASWFGDAAPRLPLGAAFHAKRLRIVSSQVGMVASAMRPRWTARRRLAAALDLLADHRLDAMITAEVAFGDLPARLPDILADGAPGLATAVRYD